MERVSVFEGDEETMPLLLIAPHGPDDENTDLITEKVCENIGCFGVINRGFKRAANVDYFDSKADCNNIDHCTQEVVKEEFLDPIQKYVRKMLLHHEYVNVFIIHGMSNKKEGMDLILGYGNSNAKQPSFSCDIWRKNAMLYILDSMSINSYNGKAGGSYAGAKPNNLNQFYRHHELDEAVNSMQFELSRSLRMGEPGQGTSEEAASLAADLLSASFESYLDFLDCKSVGQLPPSFSKDWQDLAKRRPSF